MESDWLTRYFRKCAQVESCERVVGKEPKILANRQRRSNDSIFTYSNLFRSVSFIAFYELLISSFLFLRFYYVLNNC